MNRSAIGDKLASGNKNLKKQKNATGFEACGFPAFSAER
jgi:hypothetical protein